MGLGRERQQFDKEWSDKAEKKISLDEVVSKGRTAVVEFRPREVGEKCTCRVGKTRGRFTQIESFVARGRLKKKFG